MHRRLHTLAFKTAAYEGYNPTPLTKGQIAGSINAAANLDQLVEISDASTLVIESHLTGSADADLTVQVNPVDDDGTVFPIAQPAIQSVGPTHVAGVVYRWAIYDVTAQQRVRIRTTNNNAGTQTLDCDWRLN